jgi:hypothetical protein
LAAANFEKHVPLIYLQLEKYPSVACALLLNLAKQIGAQKIQSAVLQDPIATKLLSPNPTQEALVTGTVFVGSCAELLLQALLGTASQTPGGFSFNKRNFALLSFPQPSKPIQLQSDL